MEPPKSKDAQKEIEIALAELEERVDRLRALYEQYFMGYEKIEPGVQRKDVDRRFTALRKQQIRNTALRFRFNVITQKFNTYATYWTRICRQIEEGTFKRHIARAAQRFGPATAGKREQDWSIDVEIGELEDIDMDAILAEADAAAEAYTRGGPPADTLPPAAMTDPGPSGRAAPRATPVPAASSAPRAARHVALPPGAKQPIVVRRRTDGDAPPPSSPGIRPPMGSTPDHAGSPSSSPIRSAPPSVTGRAAPAAASSSSVATVPPASTGRIPAAGSPARGPLGAPSPMRTPAAAPSPAARIAPGAARPQGYRPAALPPSANRVPVAQGPSPRAPAAPAAPNARAGHEAPPSSARAPATPAVPAPRAPAASSGPESDGPGRRPPPPLPSQVKKNA